MSRPHPQLPDHRVTTEYFSPRGDSSLPDAVGSPTAEELTGCLFFSPDDGRIWLNDQRMLLLHSSSFGTLRR
ncbi:AAA family ATPase, partial [Pseudomonas syringae pv. actinidiae]|nr:AAA family ATPase [Pseudomonas syringae pv. actinidiae]